MNVQVRSLAVFSTVKMQALTFDGSTTLFHMLTMPGDTPNIAASSDLIVSLDGVIQQPDTAYIASGNQIQFTVAPNVDSVCFIVWFQH
jgi:hypothetical protein